MRSDEAADVVTYGRREDVLSLAQGIAERQGLDPDWVTQTLAQARFVPNVVRLIMPPPAGTAKNWAAYRDRFIEPTRLRAGVE
ncbi:MAG TPA: lytic murein transglycosylase, partial [Methylibium sp.]